MPTVYSIIGASLLSGFVAAIIAPIVSAKLNHSNWVKQKKLEFKYQIFCESISSLAKWVSDAMDIELQNNNPSKDGNARKSNIRPQTVESLLYSKGLVKAFYSKDTSEAFDDVQNADISLENNPNQDFEEKRNKAIKLMFDEIFQ